MAQLTIKRVGVLSVAKIYAAIFVVYGLIVGVINLFFVMIFGAFLGSISSDAGGSVILMGFVMMFVYPILFAIFGFIGGAISALIYNVAAGMAGGIELEVEDESSLSITPPPPPQQWAATPPPYQQGQGY